MECEWDVNGDVDGTWMGLWTWMGMWMKLRMRRMRNERSIHRLGARCTYVPVCVMVVWYDGGDDDDPAMPSRSPDSYVTVHFRGMLMRLTVQSNSGSDSFPAIRRWTFDRSNRHLVRVPHLSAKSRTPENRSWMGVLSMVPRTSSFHTERVGPRVLLVGVDGI